MLVYQLVQADEALAWGPATHVRLACDILNHLDVLPGALSGLLTKFGLDFLYGNIAADVVFAKRLSKVKQFCHHWTTGLDLLQAANDEARRAFAYGYLTHLACDTVAHNKYVPRQVTVTGTTRSFGHFYWELRADANVETRYWRKLRTTTRKPFPQHQRLMARQLDRGFLPFHVNHHLFTRLNLLHSERWWYHTVRMWDRVTRWPLSRQLLDRYRQEAMDRSLDVLTRMEASEVMHEDPNGNLALQYVRDSRRYLRKMRRAGLLLPHMMNELVHAHEPDGSFDVPDRQAG